MRAPVYQRLIRNASFALAGVLALGEFLGALHHALSLITPSITYWASGLISLLWLTAELLVGQRKIYWVMPGDKPFLITSLGPAERLAVIGAVLLLWLPRFYSPAQEKEPEAVATSQREINLAIEVARLRESVDSISAQLSKAARAQPTINITKFPDRVIPIKLARYESEGVLPTSEIDRILSIASVFLSACNVRVERAGKLASTAIRNLESASDMRDSQAGVDVNLVHDITWCSGASGLGFRFGDCTVLGGDKAFLALGPPPYSSQTDALEGLELAHSLGHLAGLPHEDIPGSLMNSRITPLEPGMTWLDRVPMINAQQCKMISDLPSRFQKRHPATEQ